jgi:hypothetical protein
MDATALVTEPKNRTCWWPYNSTMLNNFCHFVVSADIPLVIDNGGYKNVTVTAKGYDGQNVGCRAEGTDLSADNFYYNNGGAYTYLSQFGVPTNIYINGAYVPGSGSLVVNCQVGYGAMIYTVNWDG